MRAYLTPLKLCVLENDELNITIDTCCLDGPGPPFGPMGVIREPVHYRVTVNALAVEGANNNRRGAPESRKSCQSIQNSPTVGSNKYAETSKR